jgi:ribosomal protein L21E
MFRSLVQHLVSQNIAIPQIAQTLFIKINPTYHCGVLSEAWHGTIDSLTGQVGMDAFNVER